MLGKFSTVISSKIFSYPFFFSSSETPIIQKMVHLVLSQRSLKLSSVLFILFTLFCSSEVISTILSFSSLICSSASDILLLIPSKVMLKILQARLQQYTNCELPDVQAGFRKGRGTRDQIANIRWIIEKAREFQKKTSISALLTMPKPLCGSQ